MQAGGMRAGIIVVAVMAAGVGCKKKGGPAGPKLTDTLPRVQSDASLAAATTRMPELLVYLDKDGQLAVVDGLRAGQGADPKHWVTLATKDGRAKAKPVDLKLLGQIATRSLSGFKLDERMKMVSSDDVAAREAMQEDPPPPPPEEEEDEGEEESGGTGTAMMLDEGKMGKKDSDRAEGQYKMKRADDPQLARTQALEAARSAGILGSLDQGPSDGSITGGFGGVPRDTALDDPRLPHRQSDVFGLIEDNGRVEDAQVLVLAAAGAKARALIDVFGNAPGLLAVSYQGTVRVLRLEFPRAGSVQWYPEFQPWVEARIGADAVEVEAVPDQVIKVPWPAGGGDAAALKKAYDDARAARGISEREDVDLLVTPDTDVQRLVDVLVAMDAAGARVITFGSVPTGEELAKRGKRIAIAQAGQPQAYGDLDKAEIRRVIKAHLGEIQACYEKQLLVSPDIAGKVSTQFFISPSGVVADAQASGVDAALSECVAGVIKAMEFPKPAGGGGVQVNYPFVFRH